jgi:hypothetical protein
VTVDLLATAIESRDRWPRARDGTVVVCLDPALRPQDVQREDADFDFRTPTKARYLRSRPMVGAIFHWIRSGTYTVRRGSPAADLGTCARRWSPHPS